ncbi:MAG: hypothetical protein J6M39_00100 [Lachnospiraceae bacterium]|nr:hypothetical protein [Lachnospiraceae bacterium]
MIKRFKIIAVMIIVFLLIISCNNKNSDFLNNKFLELYQQLEMQEYGTYADYDKLSEEELDIVYANVRIKEVNFDKEGKLWCLQIGDGRKVMTIYDTKGNRIDYVHTFTTNGGDEGGNWYDKYEEGNDEETSEEEVLDIFSEYNELDVDSKRGLRLIINSKKTIPKHLIQDDDDKNDTILFGKYNQIMSIDTRLEWRVLYKENSKALLLSSKILDWKKIDSVDTNLNWNDSDLQHFINDNYYNKIFSSKEKTAIISNEHGEYCSLLTTDDIDKYFNNRNILYLKARCSMHALFNKLMIESPKVKEHIDANEFCEYWLKFTNGTNVYNYINEDGKVCSSSVDGNKGVRPIIWVALK